MTRPYRLSSRRRTPSFLNLKLIIALVAAGLIVALWMTHPPRLGSIIPACDRLYVLLQERLAERSGVLTTIKKEVEFKNALGVAYKQLNVTATFIPGVRLEKFWQGIEEKIPGGYWVRKKNLDRHTPPRFVASIYHKFLLICRIELTQAVETHMEEQASPQYIIREQEALPPEKRTPQIAFVIDDVGNNRNHEDLFFKLPPTVTMSILPQLPFSAYFAFEADRRGHDVMVHLPLEANNPDLNPGPGAVYTAMSEAEIRQTVIDNLATVPTAVGVNNHMGSKVTSDDRVMRIILELFKERNLFFLDSVTSASTVGYSLSHTLQIPTLKRDVFLDNTNDPQYIKEQIDELVRVARREGSAIGIGHYRRNTLRVIAEVIPQLEAQGIEIVRVRELL